MEGSYFRPVMSPNVKMQSTTTTTQVNNKVSPCSTFCKKEAGSASSSQLNCDNSLPLTGTPGKISSQVYYSSDYLNPSGDAVAGAMSNGQSVPYEFPKPQKNSVRPRKCSFPRHSPQELKKLTETYYAGAKFSNHPHPSQLPKPPQQWIDKCLKSESSDLDSQKERCRAMSAELKLLLKVDDKHC